MHHRLLSILMCLTMAITACAQGNILTREANSLCDSDEMMLQVIPYFYANGCGDGIIWNFSSLDTEGEYKINHYIDSLGRTLAMTDHDITYYKVRTDTLYITGNEAPLYKTNFVSPQLVLHYPFAYGDSISAPFRGDGVYCGDHYFREQGVSTVNADAAGDIVMNEDTIHNVLRIYTLRSYSICMDMDSTALDTARLKQVIEEHYDWYARGYRYPIFTTVTSTSYSGMTPIGTSQHAYCMLPDIQKLIADSCNEDIRRSDSIAIVEKACANEDIIHYTLSQNSNQVAINYSLDKAADVTVLVSDVLGVVYRQCQQHNRKGGGYSISIDCNGLRRGKYILYINVSGKVYNEKITVL